MKRTKQNERSYLNDYLINLLTTSLSIVLIVLSSCSYGDEITTDVDVPGVEETVFPTGIVILTDHISISYN